MPIRGLSMGEMLRSRRRDFGDVNAAPPPRPGPPAIAPKKPWYKDPITYVMAGLAAVLIFGPSLMTRGGRARTPRPFGRA